MQFEKNKKKLIIAFLFFSLFNFLIPSISKAEIIEEIVAKVNNEIITLTEFEEYLAFIGKQRNVIHFTKDLKGQALNLMIDDLLLFQLAESKQIYIYEDEIGKELDRIKKLNGPFETEEDWQKFLSENLGTTNEAILRNEVKKSIVVRKLFQYYVSSKEDSQIETPSDTEIKNFYNENKEFFIQKDRIRLSHILFKYEENDAESYQSALSEADEVLNELKNDKIDFVSAVKLYSDDEETKQRGGDLNYFTPEQIKKNFPEIADTILSKEVGSLTDVFETEQGLHIIKIVDKTKGRTKPLEEVKSQIVIMILEGEANKIIADKVNKLELTSRIETLLFDED